MAQLHRVVKDSADHDDVALDSVDQEVACGPDDALPGSLTAESDMPRAHAVPELRPRRASPPKWIRGEVLDGSAKERKVPLASGNPEVFLAPDQDLDDV